MTSIDGRKEFAAALKLKGLVLVDFTAAWCAPCQALKPRLEALEKQHAGELHIVQVDIDAAVNVSIARAHSITVVPTLLFFRDGEQLLAAGGRVEGAPTVKELARVVGVMMSLSAEDGK